MTARLLALSTRLSRSLLRPAPVGSDAGNHLRDRVILLTIAMVAMFAIIQVRLLWLANQPNNGPRSLSAGNIATTASRPRILDRNGQTLAMDIEMQSLFAEPRKIENPDETYEKLVTVLPDLDFDKTMKRLKSGSGFEWLKREITPRQQADILALGLPGIKFRGESRRYYPSGPTASHILGHTNIDNQGIAGLEKHLDDTWLKALHQTGFALRKAPEPVTTSIDLRVQHFVRDALAGAMERYRAIGASAVVLNAHTGEIVAMASLPDYDPNAPKDALKPERLNRMTAGVYEMGSTFKVFSTAMALDAGTATLSSRFDARKPLRFGRHTIGDFHAKNRILSVPEIFIHSSNIGTARIAETVGIDNHKAFFGSLGLFDKLSGLELPEVAKPDVPKVWKKITATTISFGHGMSTTPLQTAVAAGALMNGGTLIPPTLMPRSEAEAAGLGKRVVQRHTSDKMRYLMRLNVLKGSGKRADVPGYLVGGKTGTAEKVVNKRYSSKHRFNAFLSAFPVTDPRYVVLVTIDEPKPEEGQKAATAGRNAAPVVGEIIRRSASILGVQPDFRVRDTAILSSYRR